MSDYKTWTTAISTYHTDADTLKKFASCGVMGMELSVDWDYCPFINWQELCKSADESGVRVLSYHLPFSQEINISLLDEEKRKAMVDYQKMMIAKAADIGIVRCIIHPSSEPIADDERHLYMASSMRSLKELAQFAAEKGVTLCVENLPRTCLGHTVEEMEVLLQADDNLRVCFDVNHLLTEYGSTHHAFVEKLGSKIVSVHMSDYDFIDEKHLFPGMGMIDWKNLIEYLEKADYNGPFLYEGGFDVSDWAPEVPYGTYEMARERHLTIKELTGKDYLG